MVLRAPAEPSIGVQSRSRTGGFALNAQHEVQNHTPLSSSMSGGQSEELLPTGPHSCQSLDESSDLAFPFQTMKDLGMKYDCFLEMSNKNFFPALLTTNPQEEAPASILLWDEATKQPILFDGAMPAAGQEKTAPETYEPAPDQDEHSLDSSASTEARLSHILKAVAAAGFDSLDNAVVTYYAKPLKEDE
ncbi:hypothetical protein BDW67DRAFT_185526 [Aspergillus spinulosporus]